MSSNGLARRATDRGQRDFGAARFLRESRVNRGLSHEALSWAIYSAGFGTVSSKTIRRIEEIGCVPTVRVQYAIASFFAREVTDMWPLNARRRVAA